MSNSIRRPRRRPRKESASLLTLKWVLVREAYLRMILTGLETERQVQWWREYLSGCRTTFVERQAAKFLERWPARAWRP